MAQLPARCHRREPAGAVLSGAVKVFDDLMQAHLARNKLWQGDIDKGPLYSVLELAGEVGELCNVAKKLERTRLGMVGSKVTPQDFEDELGDVIICAFIVAAERGIDPMAAAARKFNKTSRKLGFPIEMEEPVPTPPFNKED